MRRTLSALMFVLLLPATVLACMWDSDTLKEETKGMPEIIAAITGRFPRNPPAYYELRLKRVTAHLADQPRDLPAYDDAGVACDRLGRGDEAIAWMGKKREQLDRRDAAVPEVKEQWYRYHANLGTFLAHRWIRNGSDRSQIDAMTEARNHIARALEINPDAHFGREKYQLQAMNWIITPPPVGEPWEELPNILDLKMGSGVSMRNPQEAHKAVRGLQGLIVLGNAWESVDIFHALEVALARDSVGFPTQPQGGRNSIALLAFLRCMELIDAGKGSMHPNAPRGEDLKHLIHSPEFMDRAHLLQDAFPKMRAEADAWQAARLAFMEPRLAEGRHPDTDTHFWDGYQENPPPNLPVIPPSDHDYHRENQLIYLVLAAIVGLVLLVIGGIGALIWRWKIRPARLAAKPVVNDWV